MSGGNSVSPSLASRLGIQQQTRNSQQLLSSLSPAQQKQLADLATSSLKAGSGSDLFLIFNIFWFSGLKIFVSRINFKYSD